jgi:hypothetical protein
MTEWQYAQLRVTYEIASRGGKWTIDWHGPDATTTHDKVEVYSDVVAELNRAGTQGWELADIATSTAEADSPSTGRDWSLTRYTFRRLYDSAAESAERTQQGRGSG